MRLRQFLTAQRVRAVDRLRAIMAGKVRCCARKDVPKLSHMKVSVIIPALNEETVIERAAASAWQAGASEVIVVDGGSTDRTAEIARRANCLVLESPAGRAAQQNAGAAESRGDVLLFLHADNWLAPRSIDQIADIAGSETTVGGCFQQQIAAAGWMYRVLERGNACRARWLRLPYGDQGLFVRRAVFFDVGGFASVPLMEDVILARRLRRLGRLAVLPGPIYVNARRWKRHGVVRQTLRNWWLLAAFYAGVTPDRLAHHYRRHDRS